TLESTIGMSKIEEEDDFMSDSFLAQLSDVRPGLNSAARRSAQPPASSKSQSTSSGKWDRAAKQQEKKAKQAEALQTALATPLLTEASPGSDTLTAARSMMLRMGYQPGRGLGRAEQGRLEPVSLSLKADRSGLGHLAPQQAASRKRAAAAAAAANAEAEVAASAADFRLRMSAKFARADVGADLARAQRACRRLDTEAANEAGEISPPPAAWFWPPELPDEGAALEESADDADEQQDGEEPSPEEQLRLVVDRLRRLYSYCLWCGHRFDSPTCLLSDCPGPERADHDS
ncbi:hypothetical protein BOX15_Mlig030075g1, partial [Macrostomum lignano]